MISLKEAENIARSIYGIHTKASRLPGDEDQNFKLESDAQEEFILKISPPETSLKHLEFLTSLANHLNKKDLPVAMPRVIPASNGTLIHEVSSNGVQKYVRLISWLEGRIWATINPKTALLRNELGRKAGAITNALLEFNHPEAQRFSHWNLGDALWTFDYLDLFSGEHKRLISKFHQDFRDIQSSYLQLPKSIIHGDVNDYNILVSHSLDHPTVHGIFDFGDAIATQTINDVAITIAYAIIDLPNPLEGAIDVLSGYQTSYRFSEEELNCLYALIAMRLVTTVTKAALRRTENTATAYHSISEQPAWDVLEKWGQVNQEFATYYFRYACGYAPHPLAQEFEKWTKAQSCSFSALFPSEKKEEIYVLDLKISSTWIGSRHEFNDLDAFEFKINQLQKDHPNKLIADGYLEPRPIYTSTSYDREGNLGPESRSVHLGVDFWLPAGTPVHSLYDAEVYTAVNDKGYKEYGGLIILKHHEENITFYTLYGHLSAASAAAYKVGDRIKKEDCIGYLGTPKENGEWSPHLHFQVMLTMLNFTLDFPGVCYPSEIGVFKSLCPDPNLLFKNEQLKTSYDRPISDLLHFRNKHLGKSLSVSYKEPLHIVRGDGVYLMDPWGQKYLDTVNNVAHVGHENPKVVFAGQRQMALLNTNTRYLNEEIKAYAEALLATLPKELSVLHFVNSGSEANELAIRMAKTATKKEKMLAIEIGYHGNTNAVIDVSSYKFDGKGGKGKPKNTYIMPMPDPFRGMHRGDDCGSTYATYAEKFLSKPNDVAAFIGEPIISCGGQIVPPKGYFKEVYRLVRESGGLCIADEVQTGFGRVGSAFWAFELHDVIPDIVTMGKPIGNGHPLAAVACTKEVAETFANGMEFFNTFGGNPVSCAIGRTVLEVIQEEKLQENALKTGDFLKNQLLALQSQFSIIGEVRGEGLFLGFELVSSQLTPLPKQTSYLVNRMKEFNILMSSDGPNHNVIKIKPPIVFNIHNAKELIFRLKQVFEEDFMQPSRA